MPNLFDSIPFWLGLLYVTFPLNLLVYGWNDIVDYEADKFNPRKGNYLFGAKASKEQLDKLWLKIIGVQLLFLPFLFYFIGVKFLGLLIAFCLINGLYNLPKNGLRSRPPLELLCQIGYLLIVPLSIWLNHTSELHIYAYIYLLLFAFQSHLIGEVMDIEPDRKAGKKTTATILGIQSTKALIILIVAAEVMMLFYIFKDPIFGSMLGVGLAWLIIDLLLIYKSKIYSVKEMKLFAYLSNLMAILSMSYVWWSGCLLLFRH